MLKVEKLLPLIKERLITVSCNAPLSDVAKLLCTPENNLIIVCDNDDKMVGVIAKTDIVRHVGEFQNRDCGVKAGAIMTKGVVSCLRDGWLRDIWAIIKQKNLKNIPVIDAENRPIGILNVKDALQALLEDVEYEEQLLREYVMGIGYR